MEVWAVEHQHAPKAKLHMRLRISPKRPTANTYIYICICTWSLEISCKPRKLHIMYVRGVCGPQKHKPESSGGHCGTAQTDGVPTSSRYILRQICLLHVVGAYIFIEPEIRMATLIRLTVCI